MCVAQLATSVITTHISYAHLHLLCSLLYVCVPDCDVVVMAGLPETIAESKYFARPTLAGHNYIYSMASALVYECSPTREFDSNNSKSNLH